MGRRMRGSCCTSLLLLLLGSVWSCAQRTIEYRRVPSWAKHLGASETSDVDEDGNEIRWVYESSDPTFVAVGTISNEGEYQPGAPPPAPREETPQGPMLHCMLPMHVVSNFRECLVNEEYDLIWDQLLSEGQRGFYEAGGETGRDAFERFLRQARKDLVTCLRRIEAGDVFGDVQREMIDANSMAMRLHPRVQGEFPVFGIVIVKATDGTLKLQDILFKQRVTHEQRGA